ncbi:hypothetical protein EYF80_055492 [Liparis tanakae]|uniref:Uncharacterized protein n=1 Tax=Liparis tanakae TaxID=230148 RepID=A0A4Z2EZF5_9TELE|nr:hypothetical protein EYF80_055492 [Liparis tanakae]
MVEEEEELVEEAEEEEEEEEEEEYLDETQVYLRSKFYESWLWTDVNLPDQADRDGDNRWTNSSGSTTQSLVLFFTRSEAGLSAVLVL